MLSYPTVICAVTADKEVWVDVEFHARRGDTLVRVVHVVRVLTVDAVHTRDGNVLLAVRDVLDVTERLHKWGRYMHVC